MKINPAGITCWVFNLNNLIKTGVLIMNYNMDDTIAAISTPPGCAGIGKIRISGEDALEIADQVFYSSSTESLKKVESHTIHYGFIRDKDDKDIDEVLALILKAPKSFTAEDTVEFDCHGGSLPLQGVLDVVLSAGARLAEPGEFSKRAFMNGRIDLTQAEGIMDLINSQTEKGRELAVQHLKGGLSDHIKDIREQLMTILAGMEASIDFPEDEVPGFDSDQVNDKINQVIENLNELIQSSKTGQIFTEGVETVIVGKPNVGKSSLLNYLLKENRAIVTEIPGTTRDIISELVNLGGIPLRITDTAGIRETSDQVEKIGVERTINSLQTADLVLLMLDVSQGISPRDYKIYQEVKDKPIIILVNKTDLSKEIDHNKIEENFPDGRIIYTSVQTGAGLKELEETIKDEIMAGDVKGGYDQIITRMRHRNLLEEAKDSLELVIEGNENNIPPDLLSVDLKDALLSLGEITGETVTNNLIDQIFQDFCIGK